MSPFCINNDLHFLFQKKKSNKKVRTVQSIADDWSESDDEVLKIDEAKAKQVSANLVNKIYMQVLWCWLTAY